MAYPEVLTGADNRPPEPDHPYRCACCEGVIEFLPRETIPDGLDLGFNFVFDECQLVCRACTVRLIDANKARAAIRRR